MYWSASQGDPPPALALQVLTWSFLTLAFPVLLLTRRQRGRGWSVVALAVFAISALHLSRHDGTPGSLAGEIIGHHASIPLIFAILYQDFRFALADVFLKRACDRYLLHLTQVIRIKPGQPKQPLHRDRLAWGGFLKGVVGGAHHLRPAPGSR